MIDNFLTGKAAEYRHVALSQCVSTNAECLSAAKDGDRGNLWISAVSQTGGKGSRGRSWVSEKGNLYASLLLVDACERQHLAELTFVAAIAVRKTLVKVLGEQNNVNATVKWPNDILLNGRKTSGILLESSSVGNRTVTSVGIGINCKHHPTETNYPATDLYTMGCNVEPEDLLMVLADKMAETIASWSRGANFSSIRNAWLANAKNLGEEITVKLPQRGNLTGIFETIDEHGLLLLKQSSGNVIRISVGDVFLNPYESQE